MVLGIDGCRAGWVAIALHEDGAFADAAVAGSLDEIFVRFPRFRTAGIDMPLILLGAPRRPADIAARKLLGPVRGRSVFPAPPTFVIEDEWLAASVADVNRESRKRYGNGVPAQSLALRGKIREVNDALAAGHPVIEVHPELSFAAMNGLGPIEPSKKSFGGMMLRLQRLADCGIRIPIPSPGKFADLPADDVLDAAAAAWSAWRHARSQAGRVPPAGAEQDKPAIWF